MKKVQLWVSDIKIFNSRYKSVCDVGLWNNASKQYRSNVTLNSSILRCCCSRARNKDKNCMLRIKRTEDCSYYLGILENNSWHIASAVYLCKVTDHLHLLVSINRFPTATRMFREAEKKQVYQNHNRTIRVLWHWYPMAGIWPSSLSYSTHLTPKSIIKRKAVHNMPPFYTLHSLCSIPSTLEYNLRESLQVQLHLTRKGGEERFIQVFFFKYLIFCLSH